MRRPRRRCVICGERRAVEPETGWCDECEAQEEFGAKIDDESRHGTSWLPEEMAR